MQPLFKNVLLRIEKPKEELDSLFNKVPSKRPEVVLIEYAQDCDDIVHTLKNKKVDWNGKSAVTVEEKEEYILVVTKEENLTLIL